jgi:hypothetical protein
MPARYLIVTGALLMAWASFAPAGEAPTIRLETGHPWRPPFGLDRVGRAPRAIVELPAGSKLEHHPALVLKLAAKEVGRYILERTASGPPFRFDLPIGVRVDELVLIDPVEPEPRVLARLKPVIPDIEADAIAVPDRLINPVDLGTILVPDGWLLLGPDQTARVTAAAFSRLPNAIEARLTAWLDSKPDMKLDSPLVLREGRRAEVHIESIRPPSVERDTLRITLTGPDGRELWRKAIPVMVVHDPPHLPGFGATRLKLRYDAPISVRDPQTGNFSSVPYDQGWDESLDDVVVSLPNGARFVFWRGSSYVPFWAGAHNTGLCYEWAENLTRPADAVDCVEPLMDKELRYGRVEIVESTPARVRVRWRYQSTDLNYRVWGDEAVEEYTFYPDGFGTRVLNLKSDPASDYELSEFIILAPQDAYPFAFMSERPIDVLRPDGASLSIRLPVDRAEESELRKALTGPAIYRVRLHRDEPLAAIYFNPDDREPPPSIFGPFSDQGRIVTPAYWGSHWPLARGNATGSAIDERIHVSPSHNSLMTWAKSQPEPLQASTVKTLDAQGRPRTMLVRRWAWLIGMTDAWDDQLRARAASYASPPAVSARGASVDFGAYAPERRALRLTVEAPEVTIDLDPSAAVVNPVLELARAPGGPIQVALDDQPLDPAHFAWDGHVLWLDRAIESRSRLTIRFADSPQANR